MPCLHKALSDIFVTWQTSPAARHLPLRRLLKQIEPAKNQHDANARVGAHPSSRASAAGTAGISAHQAKQAIRVANVPTADFERQVGFHGRAARR